jgi:formamidopyrimidine-DNA glycosylase
MPELPEVETTARRLESDLIGRTIERVHLGWPRHTPDPAALTALLPGRQVTHVGRRGKYLVIALDPPDRTLLIHLRMSGRLSIVPSDAPADPYAHTILKLDNGHELRFSDTRKFGKLYLLSDPQQVLGKLGPEPLSPDFTVAWLATALAARRRAIKPLLLEQTFVAGLGNIYTDEVLFRARIDPRRPADSLTGPEVERLHGAIRQVLREAIAHQGTSLDWVYPEGTMQERLQVYGREDEPCARCQTPIRRIVLGQRGTHFCPSCQA